MKLKFKLNSSQLFQFHNQSRIFQSKLPSKLFNQNLHNKISNRFNQNLIKNLNSLSKNSTQTKIQNLSSFKNLLLKFKWYSIRSFQPYRTDDYSAFASLFILINLILISLGTTTFLGWIIEILNQLGAKNLLIKHLSNHLSNSFNLKINFDSTTFLSNSKNPIIRFQNVKISNINHQIHSNNNHNNHNNHHNSILFNWILENYQKSTLELQSNQNLISSFQKSQILNSSQFHLNIDNIDISLSLTHWLDGKGLIKKAKITGIRGAIDRTHSNHHHFNQFNKYTFRNIPCPGDFHLEEFIIKDLLVTIFQPNQFRPYTFSIFNATFNKLRKQWLFLDLLSADQISGQIDNCLFSLHKPQSINHSNSNLGSFNLYPSQNILNKNHSNPASFKKFKTRLSRFRIDGLPIDHLQANSFDNHSNGPLSWINNGKLDVIADIRLPLEVDELDLRLLVKEIVDNFEKEFDHQRISERPQLIKPPLKAPNFNHINQIDLKNQNQTQNQNQNQNHFHLDQQVIVDLDLRFKDLKASVPLFSKSLSYVNNALIRPIVAFINANRTLIPIKCQVRIDLEDFNGSWTTFDIGLFELISEQVYEALAYHVCNDQVAKSNRLTKVGKWGIQMTANAILSALKYHWDVAR